MTKEAYERQNHFRRANEMASKIHAVLMMALQPLEQHELLMDIGQYKSAGKDRHSSPWNRRRDYKTMAIKRASRAKHNKAMRGGR